MTGIIYPPQSAQWRAKCSTCLYGFNWYFINKNYVLDAEAD